MLRKILGTIVGLAVAMAAIGLIELLAHRLFPVSPGIDISDPAAAGSIVERLSAGLKVSVMVAWFTGTVAGSWAGLAVSRWRLLPWIVAAGVILGAVANFVAIPHPWWMQAAGILLPLLGAGLVLRAARR